MEICLQAAGTQLCELSMQRRREGDVNSRRPCVVLSQKEVIAERICLASVLADTVNTTFFAIKRNNEELAMPALCLHHITNTFESHSPLSLCQT